MIEVLEELELDRVAEPLRRLDSIDDDPAHPSDEIRVKVADRRAQDPRQVGLPGVPVVRLQVAAGDATAGTVEGVEVVAQGPVEVPDAWEVQRTVGIERLKVPVEQLPGITGVILGVSPAGQIAEDAPTPLGREPLIGPSQTELRFARAGGPGEDRQGAREQTSTKMPVQFRDAESLSCRVHGVLDSRKNRPRGPIRPPGQP